MTTTYTTEEVNELLRVAVERAGSVADLARHLHVTSQYVCNVLGGRSRPGPRILRHLGIERTEERIYRRVD